MEGRSGFFISGTVHENSDAEALHSLNRRPLPKGRHLRFGAHYKYGFPENFRVDWQVVNSGREADAEQDLPAWRFYAKEKTRSTTRWESTDYSGVHWVEAFLVNTRTNTCVARSGRLFVLIE